MKSGRSNPEYYLIINRKDIVDVTDAAKQLRFEDMEFIKTATYEDVQTAYVLKAFEEFLAKRNIRKTFEVDISDKG